MWKGLKVFVALTFCLCLLNVQAAVIRSEEAEQQETTTATIIEDIVSTTVVPEANSIPQSRDENATIEIGLVSVDPAPVEPQVKLAKLLLLSTPGKRPGEVEQQLEELEEGEPGNGEARMPTTTEHEQEQEQEQEDSTTAETTTESSDRKTETTKLFAINATLSSNQDSAVPNVAVAVATDNTTITIAEEPQAAAGDNNVAVELALVEPEAEYVLLDRTGLELELEREELTLTHDELQLGSFTHVDSDFDLQPVVHSVEIVPTRLDDPFIVNYVHNLH